MKDGSTMTFVVKKKAVYPAESFPLVQVFGPSEKPMLNLITCEGTYSREKRNYSHRTVIFSELEEKV